MAEKAVLSGLVRTSLDLPIIAAFALLIIECTAMAILLDIIDLILATSDSIYVMFLNICADRKLSLSALCTLLLPPDKAILAQSASALPCQVKAWINYSNRLQ